MPLITKQEFAGLCGKTTAWLSNYNTTKRKTRITVREDGMIDTKDPVNISFLQKHAVTMNDDGEAPTPAKVKKAAVAKRTEPEPEEDDTNTEVLDGEMPKLPAMGDALSKISPAEWRKLAKMLPEYQVIEQILKYKDTVKRDQEIEKLKLEIEKKRGEVIPVEPIGVLVFQFKQQILTQEKLTYEAFLNEISHKYAITGEDQAAYRGYFINQLNEGMLKATEAFNKKLDSTLKEYAAKRGIGERGDV